mgnify:CR=1 FL=1
MREETNVQDVVTAAIVDSVTKRVLLAKRGPGTSYRDAWHTPGGKVDPGETHAEALVRELSEELGITLHRAPSVLLYRREVASTRAGWRLRIHCYRVELDWLSGDVTPGDKTADVRWFGAQELSSVPLAPSNSSRRISGSAWYPPFTVVEYGPPDQ